jgi:uncharacterized repeat protein (TIGR03803 family)
MMIARFVRRAFGVCVALLTGCGGSQLQPGRVQPAGSLVLKPDATPLRLERVLYSFKGGADGANPYAGLLARSGGVFYGTTAAGGTSAGYGTVFELTPSGKETLYTFQGGSDGAQPKAGLIAAGNVLYGETANGGGASACSGGCGTVYALTPSGSGYTERVIYAFAGGSDGAYPVGGLLLDQSGALYGTTEAGGQASQCTGPSESGCGTVFKLTPSGSGYTEGVLYAFAGGDDGADPQSALIADSSGDLYGTTESGGGSSACTVPGSSGCGTIFKLAPSASGYSESIVYRFQGGAKDGAYQRLTRRRGWRSLWSNPRRRRRERRHDLRTHAVGFELHGERAPLI